MTKKAKHTLIISLVLFLALLIIFTILVFTGVVRIFRLDKNKCVQSFLTPQEQIVVTVGTVHGSHFDPKTDYSIADIYSLLKYINPDFVFIESRPETFEQYGVIDGPIEMLYLYSYCTQNSIPVRCIDWWQEDNQSKSNTTTPERDDHIFANIQSCLNEVKPNQRVAVFYGTQHFHDQMPRMQAQGWQPVVFGNPDGYFYYANKDFTYPQTLPAEIEKKIQFLSTVELDVINQNITDSKTRFDFSNSILNLIQTLKNQENLILQNRLCY